MESPHFSDFRKEMDKWDTYLENEEKENELRNLINSNGLVMFFQKNDSVFGCPEEGRIVFAKMKSEEGMDDANFMTLNLTSDEPSRYVMQNKDLDDIKVIDLEDVIKKLIKNKKKKKS